MPGHYQPSVYDIDNDGNLEILMADGEHESTPDDLLVWDLVDMTEDMRLEPGLCVYGPQLGNVTKTRYLDIIAANMTGIFIYDNEGNLKDQVTGLTGWLTYAVVQDIDGDGLNEIVVQSMGGRIYAYDTIVPRPEPRARSEVQFYSERRLGAAVYIPPPGRQAPIVSDPYPTQWATDVPLSITELSFTLTDYQMEFMDYTVVTSPHIGSGGETDVTNGRYSIPVSGLEPDQMYTWIVSATDGTNTEYRTFIFTTQSATPWWNTDWQYRRPIIIELTKVVQDQTDFPVLIDIIDASLTGKTQSDGDDFVFTNFNQAKLDHEIENYDPIIGHLVAWVRVPVLSSGTYTTLYMYYGNGAAANQENPEGVWDTDYMMVHHLDGATANAIDDSTNNDNDVTGATGTPIYDVDSKIDGGVEFIPNSGLTISDADTLDGFTGAATFEAWVRSDDYTAHLL